MGEMKYAPIISEWQLYFKKDDGIDNRLKIVQEFSKFLDSSVDCLNLEAEGLGLSYIGGKVSGHKSFEDGMFIFTSYIKTIMKVHSLTHPATPCAMLCAGTNSGSVYYLPYNRCSSHMRAMLDDIADMDHLEEWPGHYLDAEFKNSVFL